jgi:hypothetical protein
VFATEYLKKIFSIHAWLDEILDVEPVDTEGWMCKLSCSCN